MTTSHQNKTQLVLAPEMKDHILKYSGLPQLRGNRYCHATIDNMVEQWVNKEITRRRREEPQAATPVNSRTVVPTTSDSAASPVFSKATPLVTPARSKKDQNKPAALSRTQSQYSDQEL